MKRILEYKIDASQEGSRIGDFLRGKGYSHHTIVQLKKTERGICLNDEWAYTSQCLQNGDRLTVTIIEEESSEQIVPVELPLVIVYEDEDILVVNKPADMPIHPSINNYENTLANAVACYYQKRGIPFVYRCINRLDRDTTGLLIIAKHGLSAAILASALKERRIHRQYLAIAEGEVPEEGIIDAPIGRKAESVIERCVDPVHGECAVTHYKRLSCKKGYSLVALRLETGRTHQIRVHMKHIGHPLIGDYLYNPDYRLLDHQALHSYRLDFRHPVTDEEMTFTADPPWDWEKI